MASESNDLTQGEIATLKLLAEHHESLSRQQSGVTEMGSLVLRLLPVAERDHRFAEAVREIVKRDPKSDTSLDIASFHRNIYRQGIYDDGNRI